MHNGQSSMKRKAHAGIIREILGKYYFPHIYRTITDSIFLPEIKKGLRLWVAVFSVILVLFIIGRGYQAYFLSQEQKKQESMREKIYKEIAYWEGVTSTNQGFRDAYFMLALLNYRIEERDRAIFYLNKALLLDPNFERGRELERLLK